LKQIYFRRVEELDRVFTSYFGDNASLYLSMITRSFFLIYVRLWHMLALLITLPFAANAAETKAWVLLMQNPDAAQSLISVSVHERDQLIRAGWKLSGAGVLSTEDGSNKVQLHRMLRMEPEIARRVSSSPEELAANLKEGFVSEGVLGYAMTHCGEGDVPVHCFSKGDRLIWVSGHHEQYWADHNGWKREPGIFWLSSIE
jgi:hypothetical protein